MLSDDMQAEYRRTKWREEERRIRRNIISIIIVLILFIVICCFFPKKIWSIIARLALVIGLLVDIIELVNSKKENRK